MGAQASVLNAQANIEDSRANLVKADVAVLDAKRTLDRNLRLMEEKVIAQATLDTAQTNYDTAVAQQESAEAQLEAAKPQVESAKAQVEEAKAALKLAEINMGYTTIRSPVHGIVISRNVDVGQTVAASLQAPTLFTIAKDLTQMQVDTNVSEADVGRIAVGQDSTFTVDAYPERIFHGRVSEIRNAPIIAENVVTYDAVIEVNNQDLRLKPGMTANISIAAAHREGVLKIPNTALRFQPGSGKGGNVKGYPPQTPGEQGKSLQGDQGRRATVWVLSQKGKPTPVSIVLGITDGTFSEVMAADLRERTEVIIEETSNRNAQSQASTPPPFMGGAHR